MPHQIRSDDLMALVRADPQHRETALLRATTTLYCQDSWHDRDAIRRYEQLATYFLPRAPVGDRVFVAELLADQRDAPESVIRMLARDIIEVAAPVLKRSMVLTHVDLLGVISAAGADHHRLIAARPELHRDVVKALGLVGVLPAPDFARPKPLATGLTAGDDDLEPADEAAPEPGSWHELFVAELRNLSFAVKNETQAVNHRPATPLVPPVVPAAPLARAIERDPAVIRTARHPLAPPLPEPEVRVAVPPPPPRRSEVPPVRPPFPVSTIHIDPNPARRPGPPTAPASVEREPLSPMAVAGFLRLDRTARLRLIGELSSRHARERGTSAPRKLEQAVYAAFDRARIVSAARSGDRITMTESLASVLRVEAATLEEIIADVSGEGLVLLVKAAGLGEMDARTVLLLANPKIGQSSDAFFRLADLYASIEQSVADAFISGWRETATVHQFGHMPLAVDAPGVRARQPTERPTPGRLSSPAERFRPFGAA